MSDTDFKAWVIAWVVTMATIYPIYGLIGWLDPVTIVAIPIFSGLGAFIGVKIRG